jgi:hypothetical protein
MATTAQILTDLNTVVTNGFATVTKANAIAPAGPIEDMTGMVNNAVLKVQELKVVLANLILNVDSSTDSANLALLTNIQSTLV